MSRYLLTNDKMFDTKHNTLVYEEFLKFKEIFFEKGVSFFDPTIKLFDDDKVFYEFENRIIQNYDDSKLKSLNKYLNQLKGSSKKFRHFFACIIWLYNYPIHDKKNSTKSFEIQKYLGEYCQESLQNTEVIYSGIANYGILSQYIYYDINFIYFFTKQYVQTKDNPHDIIASIDLYSLMKELSNEQFKKINKLSSRHMLNYLFNPDEYEPVVDTSCKEKIVSHYLGKVENTRLDEDIHKIRQEITGFENSLFLDVCRDTNNIAYVSSNDFVDEKKNYEISLSSQNYNDFDLIKRYKQKIENGLNAEILVYNEIIKNIDKKVLMKELIKILGTNKLGELSNKLEQLIHYSKNFNQFAPFDLFYTRGQELVYVEVKSTTGNEIFFSNAELEFAFKNLENYMVKVVKENKIYNLDLSDIIIDYHELRNSTSSWKIDTIKVKIDFSENYT